MCVCAYTHVFMFVCIHVSICTCVHIVCVLGGQQEQGVERLPSYLLLSTAIERSFNHPNPSPWKR